MLDAGREARLRLAVYDAFDRRDADPALYRQAVEHVVALYQRLRAEQLAELGVVPRTVEGCIAVLYVAAEILAVIAGDDELARP